MIKVTILARSLSLEWMIRNLAQLYDQIVFMQVYHNITTNIMTMNIVDDNDDKILIFPPMLQFVSFSLDLRKPTKTIIRLEPNSNSRIQFNTEIREGRELDIDFLFKLWICIWETGHFGKYFNGNGRWQKMQRMHCSGIREDFPGSISDEKFVKIQSNWSGKRGQFSCSCFRINLWRFDWKEMQKGRIVGRLTSLRLLHCLDVAWI